MVTSYFLQIGMFPLYPIFSSLVAISTREHYTADASIVVNECRQTPHQISNHDEEKYIKNSDAI